jgi:hypothetical protein
MNTLRQKIFGRDKFCYLFLHQYVITKKVNEHFKEYECSVCHLKVTNDPKGHKITMTTRLKDINETLFYLNLKRQFLSKFYFQKKE